MATARASSGLYNNPEGPNTQYSRTLVPNTIKGMVLGTRVLNYWVLGPSAYLSCEAVQQPLDERLGFGVHLAVGSHPSHHLLII